MTDTAADEVLTDVPDDAPPYSDSYEWQPATAAQEPLLIGGVHMTRAEYDEALPLAKHLFVTEWADDGLTWDDARRNEKAVWLRRARNTIKTLREAGFHVSR